MEKELEEAIKILEELIKGDEDCLKIDLENNLNDEDIQHWKKEIKAIKTIINYYNKEKARADKLEKEYSKMLTKLDEYEAKLQELDNSIPKEVIENKIAELWIKCPKNSINEFMINERNNKIEVLQEILEGK